MDKKEVTKEKESKEIKETMKRKGRPRTSPNPVVQAVSAFDKVQAILAVWTERVKAAEVCRQMGVNPITFYQWQDRAMEGMLQALESRVNLTSGAVLSPRLQALLNKRLHTAGTGKLETKLARLAGGNKLEPEEVNVV
jgi:transposase-like protein